MTRRHLWLALPALALAGLLLLPDTSFAQFRGWRSLGGRGGGYGNSWGGANTWGGYGNYGYSPYQGGYYSPYNSWGGYSGQPSYGAYPQVIQGTAGFDTGYANVMPGGDYQSFYPSGGTTPAQFTQPGQYSQPGQFGQQGQFGQVDNSRARIHIRVPANAQVFFDDSPTRQTGTERNFVTPPLDGAHSYTYHVSARWMDNNGQERRENRTVRLSPGRTADVDFMTGANTDGDRLDNQVPRSQQQLDNNQPNRNNPNQPNLNPDNRGNQGTQPLNNNQQPRKTPPQ